jgi:hypothetical protein
MMGDEYTAEVANEEIARSRILLASLSLDAQRVATDLMLISFRAGEAAGKRVASFALMGAL